MKIVMNFIKNKFFMGLLSLVLLGFILCGCQTHNNTNNNIIISDDNNMSYNTLDNAVINMIKEDYLKHTGSFSNHELSDVLVSYQGPFKHDDKTSYICFITATYMMYTQALWSETIDGVTFNYRNGNRYQVYYDHNFYTLQEGFNLSLINHDDLLSISNNKI